MSMWKNGYKGFFHVDGARGHVIDMLTDSINMSMKSLHRVSTTEINSVSTDRSTYILCLQLIHCMRLKTFYTYEEINTNAKGQFGELIVRQALRDAGCHVYKLEKDFIKILSDQSIPPHVKQAIEMCRDKEIKVYYARREWTLKELMEDETISAEEKERIINRAEVKLKRETPDFLIYDPSAPRERDKWELGEVKFGYGELTTEQKQMLRILSEYIPCYIYRVVLTEIGVHIFKEPVHLTLTPPTASGREGVGDYANDPSEQRSARNAYRNSGSVTAKEEKENIVIRSDRDSGKRLQEK